LDYSFDVLVSWSRDLKPYNQICSSSALLGFTDYTCTPLMPVMIPVKIPVIPVMPVMCSCYDHFVTPLYVLGLR